MRGQHVVGRAVDDPHQRLDLVGDQALFDRLDDGDAPRYGRLEVEADPAASGQGKKLRAVFGQDLFVGSDHVLAPSDRLSDVGRAGSTLPPGQPINSTMISIWGSSKSWTLPSSPAPAPRGPGALCWHRARGYERSRSGPPARRAICSGFLCKISKTPEPTVPRPMRPIRTGECTRNFLSIVTSTSHYSIFERAFKPSLHQIKHRLCLSLDSLQKLGKRDKLQPFGPDPQNDRLQGLDRHLPVAPFPADQSSAVVKEEDVPRLHLIDDTPDDRLRADAVTVPIKARTVPQDDLLAQQRGHATKATVIKAAAGGRMYSG